MRKTRRAAINTKPASEPNKNEEWLDDSEASARRDAVLRVMLNTASQDQEAIRQGRQNRKKAGEDQRGRAPKRHDP